MAYQYDVSIKDAKGKIGHYRLFFRKIDSAAVLTTADIQTYVNELTARIDGVIDGQIISVRASLELNLPSGLKAAPLPTADREDGVMLYWSTTPSRDCVHNRLPTFSESLLRSDGKLQSPTPAPVVDLFYLIGQSEEIPLTVSACSEAGEDIVGAIVDDVQESFRP